MTDDPAIITTEPVLVDMDTARKMLGDISRSTIEAEMKAGRIAAQRIGKKIVFQPAELRRYAQALASWEPTS